MFFKSMKTLRYLFAIAWAISLFSCEGQEEIGPRTNPRFSVASIQEISENGVQFGANIYEFGSDQVLEYGFVYSRNSVTPTLESDDYVSATGKPDKTFSLTAKHSLALGATYYAAAFLKTDQGVVYSKSEKFVSQGSQGFLITAVEWPEKIYKDQRLIIRGQRLSRVPSNYTLSVDIYSLSFTLLDSNTISAELPSLLLTSTTGREKEVELKLSIAGREYRERKVLQFEDAQFTSQPIQKIDFDEEVIIRGDYLDQGAINLQYNSVGISNITARNKQELRFSPYLDKTFFEGDVASPDLKLTMRGVEYNLGKVFDLNPSRVTDTELILDEFKEVIRGGNFSNKESGERNQFIDESGKEVFLGQGGFYKDSLVLYPSDITFPAREMKVRVKNFGKFSNPITVKVNYPSIRVPVNWEDEGTFNAVQKGVIQRGDFGYTLTMDGVLRHSLKETYRTVLYDRLPTDFRIRNYSIFQATENFFIIGGGKDYGQAKGPVFVYSVNDRSWVNLGQFPEGIDSFQASYEVPDGLIFEQGLFIDYEGVGNVFNSQAWLYSFKTKSWTRLTDSALTRSNLTFAWNTQLFSISYMEDTGQYGLYRKVSPNSPWVLVKLVDQQLGYFMQGNPPIINGKAYLFSIYTSIKELDLTTFEMRDLRVGDFGYDRSMAFTQGKSVVLISPYNGFDIRPDLIKE